MKYLQIKTFYVPLILAICAFLLITMISCGKDDGPGSDSEPDPQAETLLDLIQANTDYSDFSQLLSDYPSLEELLDAENRNYTVFVPSAAAIESLPSKIGYASFEDVPSEILEDILQYHLVKGQALAPSDFEDGVALTTELADATLSVLVNDGSILINGFEIDSENVEEADNGYLYAISDMLIPSQYISEELQSVLEVFNTGSNEDLSLFVQLASGYDAFFEGEAITLFAPTDEAVESFMEANGIDDLADIPTEVIERLLQMHVVTGSYAEVDLVAGQVLTTTLDETLVVSLESESIAVGAGVVVENDLAALNGYVHKVDHVLLPETEELYDGTYAGYLYYNINHVNFWNAVIQNTDLFEIFLNPNPSFTLLLPPDNSLSEDIAFGDTYPLIMQHFIIGIITLDEIRVLESVFNLNSNGQYISVVNDEIYLNGNTQLIGGRSLGNGQILFLDTQIENGVYNQTIPDYIESRASNSEAAEYTILQEALQAVEDHGSTIDIITMLNESDEANSDAPFTLFAPTDAAFYTFFDQVGVADLNGLISVLGIAAIEEILLYHIVDNERVFSVEWTSDALVMYSGGALSIDPENLLITDLDQVYNIGSQDASILETNIMATNGVIHTIDQVLLP